MIKLRINPLPSTTYHLPTTNRGFTIVELIIVISIMGILLTLGVVNLRSSQANGRDVERKVDIETIAQHLEAYYTSGTDDSTDVGGYPSTSITSSQSAMTTALRDVDTNSLMAPGVSNPTLTFIPTTCSGVCNQTTADVLPQPTKDQYVYQPLHSDGTLCDDNAECRKFNLFYKLEVANISTDCPSPGFVCKLTSVNQ